ncbi:MAG: hypothetical protein KDH88_06475 [Chromatiales bacterium]|nr:hypothetical protein [Chromatiales bacterium]
MRTVHGVHLANRHEDVGQPDQPVCRIDVRSAMPDLLPAWQIATTHATRFSLYRDAADWWLQVNGRHGLRASCTGLDFDTSWPGDDRERFCTGLGLAFWLELCGTPCLHANALAKNGRALALLGASGAGKSTLSAAACRSGWRLLSDDMLALHEHGGQYFAHPGRDRIRLACDTVQRLGYPADCRPSGESKIDVPAKIARAAPLAGFIELVRGSGSVTLTHLGPATSLATLLIHGMLADAPRILSKEAHRLRILATAVSTLPVYRLEYPQDLQRLDEVLRPLEQLIR